MTDSFKIKEWDESYSRKENHIYYPKEEVVKFLNRFVSKRIGSNQFHQVLKTDVEVLKGLDLGCGIGRQTLLFEEFKIQGYGLDISKEAIHEAYELSSKSGFNMEGRFQTITEPIIPFDQDFFQIAICDSVLDSMPFEIAKQYINEFERTVTHYLFITLIGGNDQIEEETESIVNSQHEFGTVQSYYTLNKINQLIENSQWKISWMNQIIENRMNISTGNTSTFNSRYHIVLSK